MKSQRRTKTVQQPQRFHQPKLSLKLMKQCNHDEVSQFLKHYATSYLKANFTGFVYMYGQELMSFLPKEDQVLLDYLPSYGKVLKLIEFFESHAQIKCEVIAKYKYLYCLRRMDLFLTFVMSQSKIESLLVHLRQRLVMEFQSQQAFRRHAMQCALSILDHQIVLYEELKIINIYKHAIQCSNNVMYYLDQAIPCPSGHFRFTRANWKSTVTKHRCITLHVSTFDILQFLYRYFTNQSNLFQLILEFAGWTHLPSLPNKLRS